MINASSGSFVTMEGLTKQAAPIRVFPSGATRDTDLNKLDYEGFLSPLVLERYAQYMHKNRLQNDGSLRASDNWQKGIPLDQYMKSLWRHFMDLWKLHRGHEVSIKDLGCVCITEVLCAIMFNTMGYLHEILKDLDPPEAS